MSIFSSRPIPLVEAYPFNRCLEAILHTRVTVVKLARIAAILELYPVGIVEVDGLGLGCRTKGTSAPNAEASDNRSDMERPAPDSQMS